MIHRVTLVLKGSGTPGLGIALVYLVLWALCAV